MWHVHFLDFKRAISREQNAVARGSSGIRRVEGVDAERDGEMQGFEISDFEQVVRLI